MRRGGVGMRPGARGMRRRSMAHRTMRRRTRRRVRRRVRRRRRRLLLIGGAVVLGGIWAGHKLGKRDAERIEAETGRSIDEMSDEELQQAMEERGIEPEPMTDDDRAYADEMGSAEEEPDYLDQLERLSHLKDEGVITEAEFEAKKIELLDL